MAVSRVANFINNSKTAQKILRGFNDNAAVYISGTAFLLAGIARPLAIFGLPINKEDKKYSAASSISSGLLDLLATATIFKYANNVIKGASKELYDKSNNLFHENKLALRQFKTVNNRICKLATLVPIAMMRFALVKPLVNTLFKKKKPEINIANNKSLFNSYNKFTRKVNTWA